MDSHRVLVQALSTLAAAPANELTEAAVQAFDGLYTLIEPSLTQV